MEIHKPKPVHNWREFLSEISVVVVGIVIALAGEQIVETIGHDHQVSIGERALRADYTKFVQNQAEHAAASTCVAKRLAELRAIVDDGARSGVLGTVGPIPQPHEHSWEITTWDSMVASGAASHVPQAQVIRYSQISHWAKDTHATGTQEAEVWSALNSLTGAPRRFSDAEQAKLRDDIAQAAHFSALMDVIGKTTEAAIVETDQVPPAEIAAKRATGERSEFVTRMCTPISYKPAAG
jgi:hypothetical protein